MIFMRNEGKLVQVKNEKFRIFRNNLRRMWLSLILKERNTINIMQDLLVDNSGKGPLFKTDGHIKQYMNLKYSFVEMKRMGEYSICLCPVCLSHEKDMIWNSYSETWYCEACYRAIFKNLNPPDTIQTLLKGDKDYDWWLPLNRFFNHLDLIDFARIILNQELDFLNLIIKKTIQSEPKWELYDLGIMFPDGVKQISQIMSKKLVDILKEGDIQKIEAFIGLAFHIYMHYRDFVGLPNKIKKLFFISIQKITWEYYDGERQNLDWQLGQIKHLESRYIREYVTDIIHKGDSEEIENLFIDGWFDLLNDIDCRLLCDDPDINLINISIQMNKDRDKRWYNHAIEYPENIFRALEPQIREKTINILKVGDHDDIEILFELKYVRYLTIEDVDLLLKDHKFIEEIYYLKRHTYVADKEIHDFFKNYKHLIKDSLKPIIIEYLTAQDLEKVFQLWDHNWLEKVSVKKFLEIAEMEDLHFFEQLCLAVHYYGYEKKYNHSCALFPLFRNLIQMPLAVRDALKPHITSILKSGKMEAIIPMLGSHYLEILDVHEIMELINNKEVRLVDLMKDASENHNSELHYFNEMFFNWIDRFSNFLLKFDLGEIPRYRSLLDLISIHRYDAHLGMDSVNPSYGISGEETVKILNKDFYVKNGRLDLRNFFIQDMNKIEGLFSLKTLKELDLSFNWIIEIPNDIEKLQSLEKLTIIESRVGELPEEIGKLKNLKVLDVQGNYLTYLPKSLEESESLETVLLSVYRKDHSIDRDIENLKRKGIAVEIHKMNWLE